MEIFYSKRLNVKQDVVIDNRTALSRLELRVARDRSLYITPLLWRLTGKLSPLGRHLTPSLGTMPCQCVDKHCIAKS